MPNTIMSENPPREEVCILNLDPKSTNSPQRIESAETVEEAEFRGIAKGITEVL